ncbi:hypothetical protein [Arcobacter sp. CECT 8985]|uniref:hypothetical protein n=1 Tax=Arcobacter sp. CECT 8985 TaxID=1935424 RepID=UPI00100AEA32|nr:hypothetical protein [Arcobacter sp. CECT 8985]RXJ86965.1 hypothetical protein CRU93_06170 [Arcobacter sp. CECT 8985]
MLGFLGGLSSKVYLIVIAALGAMLLTVGIYSYFVSSENDELKADLKSYELALDQSVKISNQNAKEFQEFKDKNKVIIETLNASHKAELKRFKAYANKKGEIKNVKESDDGINANILNSTLQWLQSETIGANKDPKDQNISTR